MSSPVIYGLIGYPVKHSLSALMHNAAFGAVGIHAEYRLFPVASENLKEFLIGDEYLLTDSSGQKLNARDILGFNVTIPHKVKAKEILQERYPQSNSDFIELIGAINTVKREPEKFLYYNTDAYGFGESLKIDLGFKLSADKKIVILGCGGAARAVLGALVWEERDIAGISMYDINDDTAAALKQYYSVFPGVRSRLEIVTKEDIPRCIAECDLLVNTTPLGMKDSDPCVIDPGWLHKNLYVYDVVYNRQTELLKESLKIGIPAAGGMGMLLYQGARAFELWTQREAPVKMMREVLQNAIQNK